MDKQDFEKLQKRHNLPEWDVLNKEFEICTIDSEHFLLREIMKKMEGRLDTFLHLVERILSPDAGCMSDMFEARCFSDADKNKYFELFKQLKHLKVLYSDAFLSRDEKDEVNFIVVLNDEWSAIKPQIQSIIKSLDSCWLKESDISETIGYLG